MSLRLPDTIASDQDLKALEDEIHDYAKWFSHNAIKQRVDAKSASPPPKLSPAALELIRTQSGSQLLNQKSLDSLISNLNNYRQKAPTVHITLAAPATKDVKAQLVGWCRDNLSPDVLINFSFNSTILGGMVVRIGSRIFDWSFRKQILANKSDIPKRLGSV